MNTRTELRTTNLSAAIAAADPIGTTVIAGLTAPRKHLPPWLFYDARGSALFEDITRLPEYYLTRAEREIFTEQAAAIIDAIAPDPRAVLIELGAGTATKTQLLLDEVVRRHGHARYVPIDVSGAALAIASQRLACEAPAVRVDAWERTTEAAIPAIRALVGPKAVLLIGSSIGNYDEADAIALLARVRTALAPGDALVLGTDLRKSAAELVPAYDDAQGVTAAFNRNLLIRINRECGADFRPERFRHVALWNPMRSRIEMHLESIGAQRVRLGRLGVEIGFTDGERIHTESSVKYDDAMIDRLLASAGFARTQQFKDSGDRFAVHVARAA